VLGAMQAVVEAGKVRAFGLSNESCWGTTRWIDRAAAAGLPRVASVQNEYSLLCRLYDTDMAEMAVNEGVTLLAFSPLAAGLLTGKYQDGAVPAGSRMALNGDLGGRKSGRVFAAVAAYLDLAARHGLDPVHMAMAWCRTRPFPTCPIFGATTAAQLDRILAGAALTLSDEVVAEIDAVQKAHPMPY
jgi:aryl-alcohol dehydrogenase-like predicted oxidoreductase